MDDRRSPARNGIHFQQSRGAHHAAGRIEVVLIYEAGRTAQASAPPARVTNR
jgi:hypothetical protein